MATPLEVERSRTFPVAVAEAFDLLLPAPLEVIFLTGGGTMHEELTAVEAPTEFRYRITDLTGPFTAVASSVDGAWRVEPAGTGVRITWRWTVHPASSVSAVAMPVFGRLWQGYAARALDELESVLLPR